MNWLVVRKVLPPFLSGEPPAYDSADTDRPHPPVAWSLYLSERPLGWAWSESSQQATGTTELHCLVHFDSLPSLEKILPIWLGDIARASTQAVGSGEMEVESNLITNSALNQLVSFYSKFRPKSGQSVVNLAGSVEKDKLKLVVRIGDWLPREFELPLPDNKIRDGFAPETELRGLHLGQSWTIVSYSPLALPSHPVEVFQGRPPTEVFFAKVEDQAQMTWNGRLEPTWVVVYRSDAREGPGNEKNIRNRLWVRRDGTVVRQEILLGDHSLLFMRMPEKDAAVLRNAHQELQRQPSAVQP